MENAKKCTTMTLSESGALENRRAVCGVRCAYGCKPLPLTKEILPVASCPLLTLE